MKPERFEECMTGIPVRRIPPGWKADILGASPAPAGTTRPRNAWAAALWPSPLAWAALAACWLLALGLNIAAVRPGPSRAGATGGVEALAEQRRLLEELAGGPPAPAPARIPAPAGHSFVAPDRHGRGVWT